MSESFVQLPLAVTIGSKLRTFQWVIGLNTVEGESQVICDPADGTPVTITTVAALRRLGTEAAQGPAAAITAPWSVQLSDGAAAIGVLANPLRVDPTGTTPQPITAAALPLPAGAATSALQVAGNASLASIDATTTASLNATLSSRASEATLGVVAGTVVASLDTTLSSRATEATLATRGSEATLATRASEATLLTRATEATVATLLTDIQLRASPVPVSAAALPLPAGAATSALQVAGNASLASIDATTTASLNATLSSRASEATLGVVAGTVVASLDTTLSSRATEATLATRGSEATLATRASEATLLTRASEATLATRAAAATQTDGTQRTKITDGATNAAVKAAATAAVAADTALVVSLSPNSPVPPPVLTKGTQGATGFSVQNLNDAGRSSKIFQGTAIAGVVAETLLSLVMLSDLVAGGVATSYTVTVGKTFRATGVLVAWRNAAAAVGGVTVRVRVAPVAPALVGSSCIATVYAASVAATIGSGGSAFFPFTEGFEIPAGAGIGITQQAVTVATGFDVRLIGYEY